MAEPKQILNGQDDWLRELNRKRKVFDEIREIKPNLSAGVYRKALEVHEAEEHHLHWLSTEQLEALARDLRKNL